MNKRAFLEGFFTASTVAFGGHFMWQRIGQQDPLILNQATPRRPQLMDTKSGITRVGGFKFTPIEIQSAQPTRGIPTPAPVAQSADPAGIAGFSDLEVENYLRKIRNFDAVFASDIYLDPRYEPLLLKTAQHLARVEAYIGHGNFNLMSFDEMLQSGRDFSRIGEFKADELNFLEEIFFANPHRYGFFGKKISSEITESIAKAEVTKISGTGHFLLRGESLNLYEQIKRDVGGQVVLTSGVRSIVKQMHLFLAKTIEANGNLSRSSRSLAPPGHSYHGVGDFDIGKIGLGARNFTADFSTTDEYKKIAGLGYVDIRYPTDNLFGVRFEPWHIKIS
ncbi:MAG: M15 family metallopeptidase [Proteobacteria bacterium]|nr:M15 family metallopeptidase [Pseudomonadota bacterium]